MCHRSRLLIPSARSCRVAPMQSLGPIALLLGRGGRHIAHLPCSSADRSPRWGTQGRRTTLPPPAQLRHGTSVGTGTTSGGPPVNYRTGWDAKSQVSPAGSARLTPDPGLLDRSRGGLLGPICIIKVGGPWQMTGVTPLCFAPNLHPTCTQLAHTSTSAHTHTMRASIPHLHLGLQPGLHPLTISLELL